MKEQKITILGAFFADLACRTPRMPAWGETLHGNAFAMGPGGKGSNQAVAAARQGTSVELITRIGQDAFGDMAKSLFDTEGIGSRYVIEDAQMPTGTATIIVDDVQGENAIVIVPSACDRLDVADVDAADGLIADSALFVSQLELAPEVCFHGMTLAHGHGVPVVLNPAPAIPVPRELFARVDYITPNETEAATLTGRSVETINDARDAAHTLRDWGVVHVLITLGKQGVYISSDEYEGRIPAVTAGELVDTTGAGDAFNGGLAAALAEGQALEAAARMGCAVAGLSVTRRGTAPSMPRRADVQTLLRSQSGRSD